jgi:hypothetical protein
METNQITNCTQVQGMKTLKEIRILIIMAINQL